MILPTWLFPAKAPVFAGRGKASPLYSFPTPDPQIYKHHKIYMLLYATKIKVLYSNNEGQNTITINVISYIKLMYLEFYIQFTHIQGQIFLVCLHMKNWSSEKKFPEITLNWWG